MGARHSVDELRTYSVERFDPRIGRKVQMSPMRKQRAFFGAAVMGGKIYLCGGSSQIERGELSDVECFDAKSMRWSAVAPMLTPVSCAAVVSHGKEIYVIGG
ncbi:kelch repeat protein [Ancylostoma caninum]|uniref:Kelch repeat protein n=1 Tax=Ancylostoma caninum TaxID=29170 RepID=A0A368F837_ANCCA|nr:kelch repeat protein [Ancylostoma caninum]